MAIHNIDHEVIGIGASAGGLEAIESFFQNIPSDCTKSFIVVQHLSSKHKSFMPEIIGRVTTLNTTLVDDEAQLKPGTIYFMRPDKNVILINEQLVLQDIQPRSFPNKPIDLFFRSLAEQLKEKAVGVVLSGTGADGSQGIQAIFNAGGRVYIEDPETSQFDGMPNSAIATNAYTRVGAAELIAQEIMMPDNSEEVAEDYFAGSSAKKTIFAVIHDKFGLDLEHYKPNTITRRIGKFIQEKNIASIEQLADQLDQQPKWVDELYNEMFIGVTSFFRDTEVFSALAQRVVPDIVRKTAGDDIRLWVTACSTGQEAYSLGMLLLEEIKQQQSFQRIKIFATDIDQRQLDIASCGIYCEKELENIDSRLIARYFEATGDNSYRVRKNLRNTIVFSRHDLLSDPPFTKLDFVSCRNVLIYLNNPAQQQVISSLIFSLKPGAYLMLGTSEALGQYNDLFQEVNRQCKIYLLLGSKALIRPIPTINLKGSSRTLYSTTSSPAPINVVVDHSWKIKQGIQNLVEQYMPSSILIDNKLEVLHVFGDAGKFLRISGEPTNHLEKMLNKSVVSMVRTLISHAKQSQQECILSDIDIDAHQGLKIGQLIVKPINHKQQATFFQIIFEPLTSEQSKSSRVLTLDNQALSHVAILEQELQETKASLQSTIEEVRSTNEELQSSNEELLTSNEELQSTNEELHSVNEELYTLNREHQTKIEELERLSEDEENLLTSTNIGVVFLDKQLVVRKYTPAAALAFNLLPQDVGRSIVDITHKFTNKNIVELVNESLMEKAVTKFDAVLKDDSTCIVEVHPFIGVDQEIAGAVINIIDTKEIEAMRFTVKERERDLEKSVQKLSESSQALTIKSQALARSEARFKDLADIMPALVWQCDTQFELKYTNRHWCEHMNQQHFDATGRELFHYIHQEDIAGLKNEITLAKKQSRHISSEFRIETQGAGYRWVKCYMAMHQNEEGHVIGFLGTGVDITDLKDTQYKLQISNKDLEEFAYVASHDLKSPLRGIEHLAQWISEDEQSVLSEKSSNDMELLKERARNLHRLLDSLLAYSRLRKVESEVGDIDLKLVVQQTIAMTTEGRKFSVQYGDCPESLHVKLTPTKIILQNLIDNAIKHHNRDEGVITVNCYENGQFYWISIADDGPGIDHDQREKVFKIFQRLDKHATEGSGMGLATVKRLVEREGGEIIIEDVEGGGGGVVFRFSVPKMVGD